MSKSLFIIIGAILLGFVGLVVLYPREPERPKIGQQRESEGQQHLRSVDEEHAPYKDNPPSSGPHANHVPWGISDIEIPDENTIHNMEHGGVIITYRPDLSAEKLQELKEIAANLTVNDEQQENKGFKVILSPRAKNDNLIELTSWLWNHSLNDVDKDQIQQFYRDHLNNAPEANAA